MDERAAPPTGRKGGAAMRPTSRGAGVAARQRLRASLAALAVLGADQATKGLVLAHLSPGESAPLLGRYVSLTLVENPGAAFGLLGGDTAALVAFAALVAGIAWWLSGRTTSRAAAWALGLLLGGALGNLADRVLRHAVVDFVNVHVWPVFNLADSAITVGAVWLLWQLVRAPVAAAPTAPADGPGEA